MIPGPICATMMMSTTISIETTTCITSTTNNNANIKGIQLLEKECPALIDQVQQCRGKRRATSSSQEQLEATVAAATCSPTIDCSSPVVSDNDTIDSSNCCSSISIVSKKKKRRTTMMNRRVSFSNAQHVVEVEPTADTDKPNIWYSPENYSEFIFSAYLDAQRLRNAAQIATSSEALFMFIQSAELSPRGLEKVLQYTASSCDISSDEEGGCVGHDDSSARGKFSSTANTIISSPAAAAKRKTRGIFPVNEHSRRVLTLKSQHREKILSLHQELKQAKEKGSFHTNNSHDDDDDDADEQLRRYSELSSRWAVETALKLGHIDAQGLL